MDWDLDSILLLFLLGDGALEMRSYLMVCHWLYITIFNQGEECPPSSLTLLTFWECMLFLAKE
jgi:hypothetical protein